MKPNLFTFVLALNMACAAPLCAQNAPADWTTQTRDGGARTFAPPDLRAGEVYNVTVYNAAALDGATPDEYLRKFAGSVGTKAGQLAAPLQVETREGKVVSGIGAYVGPNGSELGVFFVATSPDDANIHVARTLFSDAALFSRYAQRQGEIVAAMGSRAMNERQSTLNDGAPAPVTENLTRGIALVPGVYVGQQIKTVSMFGVRRTATQLRVYLYANGEYRIANGEDEDFKGWERTSTGTAKYNVKRGRLDIAGNFFHLSNDNTKPDDVWCYYGRDANGKPAIYAHENWIGDNYDTVLVWQGPPTSRVAQSVVDAPAKLAKARRDAIQTTVAVGRGVPASQVAEIVRDYSVSPAVTLMGNADGWGGKFPDMQVGNDVTDDTYLLLKGGTIYRGLTVAPDQFDASASRRKEPENWGLWKSENGKLQASFGDKPYETLDGKRVAPAAAGTRFGGRYKFADSSMEGAISFTAAGRFARTAPAKGAVTLNKATKTVAGGDLKGAYSLDGTAMTLRYDNGKITRTLFFFGDKTRDTLWFEGHRMFLDKK